MNLQTRIAKKLQKLSAIETPNEEQRAVGERILELYRDERPIDVRLLEPDAVRPPSPRTTRPAN